MHECPHDFPLTNNLSLAESCDNYVADPDKGFDPEDAEVIAERLRRLEQYEALFGDLLDAQITRDNSNRSYYLAHVLLKAGVVPGRDTNCHCNQCKQAAQELEKFARGHLKDPSIEAWWRDDQSDDQNKNVMLKIDGESVKCDCGANVFTKINEYRHRCNACQAEYETVPIDNGEHNESNRQ